jgi:hypothetical protein
MRSIAIREILDAVDQLDTDEATKRQFKKLVANIGTMHGVSGIARVERVDYARRLLDAKTSRPTVRDRLIARYELSRRQAYRVIEDALQLRQNLTVNGTPEASNSVMEKLSIDGNAICS